MSFFWFSDFRAVSTIGFVRKNCSQKPIPKTTHHKIFHSSHFSPLPFPLSSQSEPPFPIRNRRFKGKSGPGEYLQLFAFDRIIFNGSPDFLFCYKERYKPCYLEVYHLWRVQSSTNAWGVCRGIQYGYRGSQLAKFSFLILFFYLLSVSWFLHILTRISCFMFM